MVAAATPLVEFRDVAKRYGAFTALSGIDLEIGNGEFLTLLGPSGSGKTTALMLLAGFDKPSGGSILYQGRSVESVPANRRNFGVVFQNYALFPHLTMAQNVAFPLKARKCASADIAGRVRNALQLVRLEQYAQRYPAQLSGGQQQRVALARALVFDPGLVLMDEPLAALDKNLRHHMQFEIKRLHRELGVTMVYVTHDQGEALSMSDRVAVFNSGRLLQVADPEALYNDPASHFVATFIGETNSLDVRISQVSEGVAQAQLDDGQTVRGNARCSIAPGDEAVLTVRPEALRIAGDNNSAAPHADENRLRVDISDAVFMGDHQRVTLRVGPHSMICKLPAGQGFEAARPGPAVIRFDPAAAFVYSRAAREAQ
jgi:putative spermidine/putrescine transport system ATP-binding protein